METSRLVSKSVPTPLNQVRGAKAQGEASRQAEPGKGKTGWVNESEPLMRLRYPRTTETATDYGGMGKERHGSHAPMERTYPSCKYVRDTSPRSKGGTHPGRISLVRNVETPM